MEIIMNENPKVKKQIKDYEIKKINAMIERLENYKKNYISNLENKRKFNEKSFPVDKVNIPPKNIIIETHKNSVSLNTINQNNSHNFHKQVWLAPLFQKKSNIFPFNINIKNNLESRKSESTFSRQNRIILKEKILHAQIQEPETLKKTRKINNKDENVNLNKKNNFNRNNAFNVAANHTSSISKILNDQKKKTYFPTLEKKPPNTEKRLVYLNIINNDWNKNSFGNTFTLNNFNRSSIYSNIKTQPNETPKNLNTINNRKLKAKLNTVNFKLKIANNNNNLKQQKNNPNAPIVNLNKKDLFDNLKKNLLKMEEDMKTSFDYFKKRKNNNGKNSSNDDDLLVSSQDNENRES